MLHVCSVCGEGFHGRADAKTCPPPKLCRQRAHRRRHGRYARDPLDRFYTSDETADVCASMLAELLEALNPNRLLIEPSAGGWAFGRAVCRYTRCPMVAIDKDPNAPALIRHLAEYSVHGDFKTWRPIGLNIAGFVGNPPFLEAADHVRHALELAEGGLVAFLLRLAFRTSRRRRPLFRDFPVPVVRALDARPSFTADGHTDQADYAVYVWGDDVVPEPGIGDPSLGPIRSRSRMAA